MIPVFKPCYSEEEIDAVADVLRSGWIGMGPKVEEFERKFAKYIGVKYAVAVNSCTAALHLALKVVGVGGFEVITTPMTFVSTNHAIRYAGGTPVFADICPLTLNIDPTSIEKCITPNTKAIVVVHYGGHPCNMDALWKIADKHKLVVVEDAAHGCGGEYNGCKIGRLCRIGCFSFHAVKNLATGDGGMITTEDTATYDKLRKLRWMGISKGTWDRDSKNGGYSWYYDVDEIGYKYHMNDIAAALGIVQLSKLDAMNGTRRDIAAIYNEAFAGVDWIETPVVKTYAKTAQHNYVIKVDDRNELHSFLKSKGISSGVHYIPSNHYAMYKDCNYPTPTCESVWVRLITLPMFPDLTAEEIDKVIDTVKSFKC